MGVGGNYEGFVENVVTGLECEGQMVEGGRRSCWGR